MSSLLMALQNPESSVVVVANNLVRPSRKLRMYR